MTPLSPQKNPLVSFLLAPSFLIKTASEAVLQSLLLVSSPITRDYQNNRESIIRVITFWEYRKKRNVEQSISANQFTIFSRRPGISKIFGIVPLPPRSLLVKRERLAAARISARGEWEGEREKRAWLLDPCNGLFLRSKPARPKKCSDLFVFWRKKIYL